MNTLLVYEGEAYPKDRQSRRDSRVYSAESCTAALKGWEHAAANTF